MGKMSGTTIEECLAELGYSVSTFKRAKYPGAEPALHYTAARDGVKYFAFRIAAPDSPGHYERIERIQESIPHMARMVGPIGDIVLLEEAHGHLLWDLDKAPEPAVVEAQLMEFARGTARNQLIHGDLRPWNVFFDSERGVQVIDWWFLSSFIDDLLPRGPLRASSRKVD
jgi:hypothetical protein